MDKKSRAEYFRKLREVQRQFVVLLNRPLLDDFDKKLAQRGITRAAWLRGKIKEELEG